MAGDEVAKILGYWLAHVEGCYLFCATCSERVRSVHELEVDLKSTPGLLRVLLRVGP